MALRRKKKEEIISAKRHKLYSKAKSAAMAEGAKENELAKYGGLSLQERAESLKQPNLDFKSQV